MSKKEKFKIANKIKAILFFVLLIVFIISTTMIIFWLIDTIKTLNLQNNVNIIANVEEDEGNNTKIYLDKNDNNYQYFFDMKFISVDFDTLLKENKDTVAFLSVNGTNINYPVVQCKDNNYYLNHTYDGSTNSAGWIFCDYRNNMKDLDKNTIIYGHSMKNKTMFGTLKNALSKDWLNNKENHIIKMATKTNNFIWQIFSSYTVDVEDYYLKTQFNSQNEYKHFLDTLKARSIFDFDVNLDDKDKILTLSTCANYMGNNKRMVVHAKLIKESATTIQN